MATEDRSQFTGYSGGILRRVRKSPDEILKLLAELKTKVEDIGISSLEDLDAVMKEMTEAAVQLSLLAQEIEDAEEEMKKQEVQDALAEVDDILNDPDSGAICAADELALDTMEGMHNVEVGEKALDIQDMLLQAMQALQDPTGAPMAAFLDEQGGVEKLDTPMMSIGKDREADHAGGETGGGIEYDTDAALKTQLADEAADELLDQWLQED